MFFVATLGVLVSMSLALIRALAGPTVYDRVLGVNVFGTKTVVLIAVLGFLTGRPEFLDLALVYA
ncbi:MAG: pH regulation protein F, partial [Thioalkalivibrio sp.]|nr:pH regulation protein F [Thioalkalivibrio sp.]